MLTQLNSYKKAFRQVIAVVGVNALFGVVYLQFINKWSSEGSAAFSIDQYVISITKCLQTEVHILECRKFAKKI